MTVTIGRRELLAAAAAWPLAAHAQQSGKVRTIGFLGTAAARPDKEEALRERAN